MQTPRIRYARSGDVRIAHQAIGQGPIDLVFVPGFISNLELHWEEPGYSHLLRRLSAFARVVHFDKRGTGLSDRVDVQHLPDLETRMDDVRAVMDAAGCGRAVLLGASEGAPMSITFAATFPERTRALVLYCGYAHFHNAVLSPERLTAFVRGAEQSWGTGTSLASFAPGRVHDPHFSAWWARFERPSVSPTAAIALAQMNATIDVRGVLGAIRVPTVVLHRREDACVRFAAGRFLAERNPGARFVELSGRDHPIRTGDIDRVVDAIEEFLTTARGAADADRVLATLLVAPLVRPERAAARLGDRLWAERVEHLHRIAGEIDVGSVTAVGLAVHVAERIAALAGAGEILVSGVVRDLAAGSGLRCLDHRVVTIDAMDERAAACGGGGAASATARPPSPAEPDLAALSGRQREVLALIADGLCNAAIAARLSLSEHTVKRRAGRLRPRARSGRGVRAGSRRSGARRTPRRSGGRRPGRSRAPRSRRRQDRGRARPPARRRSRPSARSPGRRPRGCRRRAPRR